MSGLHLVATLSGFSFMKVDWRSENTIGICGNNCFHNFNDVEKHEERLPFFVFLFVISLWLCRGTRVDDRTFSTETEK